MLPGYAAYVATKGAVEQFSHSHAISVRLSPWHIRLTGDTKRTLEQFWQEEKCLAVWDGSE